MAVTLKKRSTVGSGLLGVPSDEPPLQADSSQEQQTEPSSSQRPEKPTTPEAGTGASGAPGQDSPETVPSAPQNEARGRFSGNQGETVPSPPVASQRTGTRPRRLAASQGAKPGPETQTPTRDQLWAQVQEASHNANYDPDTWSTYSPNLPQDLYYATMKWAEKVSLGARREGRRPVRANHCLAIAFAEFLPRAPDGDIDPAKATEIGRQWLAEHPKSTVARRKSTGSRLPAELTEDLYNLGEHFRSGRIPLWAVFASAVSQFLKIMNDEQGELEAAT
jgi:hypothetical protein